MSEAGGKFIPLTGELHDYVVRVGSREDDALRAVREQAAALDHLFSMQISPDQGAFLTLLVRLIGARRALELGTFTGYSAICIARGLTDDGVLLACEIDAERAETAMANFTAAGVADRIIVRLGPAQETLDALASEGAEPFDFAFIDADKVGYPAYYESCLELLRPGGLIVIDNVLRGGAVLEAEAEEGDVGTKVIAQLNEQLADDDRVDIAVLAVADGITLALKR